MPQIMHGMPTISLASENVTQSSFQPWRVYMGQFNSHSHYITTPIETGHRAKSRSGKIRTSNIPDVDYQTSHLTGTVRRIQKHTTALQCTICSKKFTRGNNLRSHMRAHIDDRPFVCTVCGKAFVRQYDRKRHQNSHRGEKKFMCQGYLKAGVQWGCGQGFARADSFARHLRSAAGQDCIKPCTENLIMERQHLQCAQPVEQNFISGLQAEAAETAPWSMMDASASCCPSALQAQHHSLAPLHWSATDTGSEKDAYVSGRFCSDAHCYTDDCGSSSVARPGLAYAIWWVDYVHAMSTLVSL